MKNYFSHDYYSRNDPKVVRLFMKHGLSGIGAYWCIVEMLYEQGGYLSLDEYERITFELRTDENVIRYLIYESELFENDGEKFWSETAIDRLNKRAEKSQKARESIENRWNKSRKNTNEIRTYNECNTIKEKEIKEKGKDNKEKFDFKKSLMSLGIEEKIISDWLTVRKQKKAANTETALNSIKTQIELSGLPANECIKVAVERSWAGFKAEWINNQKDTQNGTQFTKTTSSNGFSRPGYDPNNGIGDGTRLSDKKRPHVFSAESL